MESQNKLIKKHLEDGHTITAIEALEKFKCFRLASRISDSMLVVLSTVNSLRSRAERKSKNIGLHNEIINSCCTR